MKLKTSVAVACFLPGRAKDLSATCSITTTNLIFRFNTNAKHI